MSSPTHEKDNYIRLSTLLIDGGTKLLRDIFHFICPSGAFQHYLASNRLLLERSLQQDQVEILYPANGSQARLENCDITLLLILFENVMHVCSRRPGKPWAYSPLELNLKLLRSARNKVLAHVPNLSLDASAFERHWSEITSVMIQLAQIINQESDWERNIRLYRSAALTSEGEQCIEKLVEWRERDKYLEEKLDWIGDKVEENNQEIKKLQNITLEGLRKRGQGRVAGNAPGK